MANVEQIQPAKGPSFVIQMVMLLVMTAAAIGMGWVSGSYLRKGDEPAPVQSAEASKEAAKAHAVSSQGEDKKQGEAGPKLVDLAPMTTNLAAPAEVWIRIEASVVFDEPQPPEMAEEIHQDLLAYIRTLKLHQIDGPSGYQHLRADLQERASLRSGGHAKEILIRTMLLE